MQVRKSSVKQWKQSPSVCSLSTSFTGPSLMVEDQWKWWGTTTVLRFSGSWDQWQWKVLREFLALRVLSECHQLWIWSAQLAAWDANAKCPPPGLWVLHTPGWYWARKVIVHLRNGMRIEIKWLLLLLLFVFNLLEFEYIMLVEGRPFWTKHVLRTVEL